MSTVYLDAALPAAPEFYGFDTKSGAARQVKAACLSNGRLYIAALDPERPSRVLLSVQLPDSDAPLPLCACDIGFRRAHNLDLHVGGTSAYLVFWKWTRNRGASLVDAMRVGLSQTPITVHTLEMQDRLSLVVAYQRRQKLATTSGFTVALVQCGIPDGSALPSQDPDAEAGSEHADGEESESYSESDSGSSDSEIVDDDVEQEPEFYLTNISKIGTFEPVFDSPAEPNPGDPVAEVYADDSHAYARLRSGVLCRYPTPALRAGPVQPQFTKFSYGAGKFVQTHAFQGRFLAVCRQQVFAVLVWASHLERPVQVKLQNASRCQARWLDAERFVCLYQQYDGSRDPPVWLAVHGLDGSLLCKKRVGGWARSLSVARGSIAVTSEAKVGSFQYELLTPTAQT